MTFSLHQGGVVMSSQIMQAQILNMTHVICFSVAAPFLEFTPTHHVTAFHPSSGDMSQSARGQSGRHRAKQKWQRKTQSSTYAPGLSTPSYLSRIIAQLPPSSPCCPRPSSHHQSNLTSAYLIPALHLLPPSTPF